MSVEAGAGGRVAARSRVARTAAVGPTRERRSVRVPVRVRLITLGETTTASYDGAVAGTRRAGRLDRTVPASPAPVAQLDRAPDF